MENYFWKNVEKLLKRRKKSKRWLAGELGITPSYLSVLSSGKRQVRLDVMEKIANVLEVKLPVLMETDLDENKMLPHAETIAGSLDVKAVYVLGRMWRPSETLQPTGMKTVSSLTGGSMIYALRVVDDSMGEVVKQGSYVIVDPDTPLENGCLVAAETDQWYTIRFYSRVGNKIVLTGSAGQTHIAEPGTLIHRIVEINRRV